MPGAASCGAAAGAVAAPSAAAFARASYGASRAGRALGAASRFGLGLLEQGFPLAQPVHAGHALKKIPCRIQQAHSLRNGRCRHAHLQVIAQGGVIRVPHAHARQGCKTRAQGCRIRVRGGCAHAGGLRQHDRSPPWQGARPCRCRSGARPGPTPPARRRVRAGGAASLRASAACP